MWPARFLLPAAVLGYSVNKWSCFWYKMYTPRAHTIWITHTHRSGSSGMPQQRLSLVVHAKLCRIINGKCLIDFYYKLCAECRQSKSLSYGLETKKKICENTKYLRENSLRDEALWISHIILSPFLYLFRQSVWSTLFHYAENRSRKEEKKLFK